MKALKSFAVYKKTHASGNIGYRVDLGIINNKRTFRSFPNSDAAEKFRQRCLSEAAHRNPTLLSDICAATRHEILAAVEQLKPFNATISDAVKFYLKHARPVKADASIGHVMDQFAKIKAKAGLSEKYLETSTRCFFKPFRDSFKDCQITEVSSEAAEKYVYRHKSWNPTTRATHLRHLNVLFNFALEKGFVALNPFVNVQRPKKQASTSADRVATVDQVIKILQYALQNGYKGECASLVLVLFCGVRVDEVTRLKWENVRVDDDTPVVVLDHTKNNRRRINALPPNALEWLRLLRGNGEIVAPNHEGRTRYLRKVSKSEFRQNAARICFASYHVAQFEDGAKTAFLLGHSNPTLLYTNYRTLVTKDAAEKYWQITPSYDGKGIVQNVRESEIIAARLKSIRKSLAAKE